MPVRPVGVGDLLGDKYEVVRELGAGAMGVVFEGRHLELHKPVAIKTIRTEISGDRDLMARFRQEAQAASAIGHPNIVQVFDLGTSGSGGGGCPYMVMEYLVGQSMADLLVKEPLLLPARAAKIIQQVLSALAAAHARGIVHRDLKPENIFLQRQPDEPEFVKLLDFGIAKVFGGNDTLRQSPRDTPTPTAFGTVLGTPQYMSPEQARGQTDIDHRTDLWSIGCVLYEMVCGRTPFEGENYNQVMSAIVDGFYPRPSDLRPSVPPALEAVICKALAYHRDKRYDSAQSMRHGLLQAVGTGAAQPTEIGTDRSSVGAGTTAPMAAHQPMRTDQITGLALATQSSGASAGDAEAAAAALAHISDGAPALVGLDGSAHQVVPAGEAGFAAPGAVGNQFGPPQEQEELALEVALPARAASSSSRATGTSVGRRGGSGATIYRQQQRSWVGLLARLLVTLAVVGGAAGVAYRYHKLGYLLTPPPERPLELLVAATPDHAELLLNGTPQRLGPLELPPDKDYQLELAAPGRLGVHIHLVRGVASPVVVRERLPLALSPLEVPVQRGKIPPAVPRAGYVEVEAAVVKLGRFQTCLSSYGESLQASATAYSRSLRRGKPRADALPVVQAMAADELPRCRSSVASATDANPEMARLEAAATEYVKQLDRLVPLTAEAAQYYTEDNYKADSLQWGRRAHGQLVELYELALAADQELREALVAEQLRWQVVEIAALYAETGETGLWHLRTTALYAQVWVRASVTGAEPAELAVSAKAFADALAAAAGYADAHPGELHALVNGAGYLDSLAPLRELAMRKLPRKRGQPPALDRDEVLRWYAACVDVFNGIVVTR